MVCLATRKLYQENPNEQCASSKPKTTMNQNQAHTRNWAVKEDNPTINENIQVNSKDHTTMNQELFSHYQIHHYTNA